MSGTVSDRPAAATTEQESPVPYGDSTARPTLTWAIVSLFAELVLAAGVILLFFIAYQTWGRVGQIEDAQEALDSRLEQSWQAAPEPSRPRSAPSPAPAEGDPFVRLSVPRLDLEWTVVEGIGADSLEGALGHYPRSQMPGKVGNFAVAGHRFRGLLRDLDDVEPGDRILVEDQNARYVYRVERSKIVSPQNTAVLAPVPGRPGVAPTESRITLTTCHPKWDDYERLIVSGELESITPKNPTPSEGTR